jgi:hypothetical protein
MVHIINNTTIEKIKDIEKIRKYSIIIIHYEIRKNDSNNPDMDLTGIEGFDTDFNDKQDTIIFENIEYINVETKEKIEDIESNLIGNRYINILIKDYVPYYNFSNEPPIITNNNSVNDDIYKTLIDKYYNNYKTKICSYLDIINNSTNTTTNTNNDQACIIDINNYTKQFTELINSTLNMPFIYKLNTLNTDDYNNLFEVDKKADDTKYIECFGKTENDQTLCSKIPEEIIKKLFKDYYKKITTYDPSVFVKWMNTLKITKEKTTNSKDDFNSHFREITKTYLIPNEINILNIVYYLNYITNDKTFNELAKDSKNIIILGIIKHIIDPYLKNNIGVFYYIYKEFFENLNKDEKQSFKEFNNRFNEILENKVNNSIITYLKIRNDNHNDKTFNVKRFPHISYDDQLTKLLVEYNSDDRQYYGEVKNNAGVKSDKKYLFGEFTKIFLPEKTNKQISEDMTNIIKKLHEGNPLFMLGYGASGAGKTSALIYYKNAPDVEQKPGVIIHLCNLMAGTSYGYTNIELQYSEFYYKTAADNKYDPVEIKNDNQITNVYPIKFKYVNNGFVLIKPYTHKIIHDYRFENMIDNFTNGINLQADYGNKEKKFDEGTPLGEIIINLVDTDRFVKATTNNPNSSRSHTLVFLKLKTDSDKEANIIVGDFAGVENEFECANPDVLNQFLNRKREDKDSNVNNTLFYSHNAILKKKKKNGILDPIDNTDSTAVDKNSLIESIDRKEDPIYDFYIDDDKKHENDRRNIDFMQQNKIDIKFMQKYVPFVRKYVGALVQPNSTYEPRRWTDENDIENAYNKESQLKGSIEKILKIFDSNKIKQEIIKETINEDITNVDNYIKKKETSLNELKEQLLEIEKNLHTIRQNNEKIKILDDKIKKNTDKYNVYKIIIYDIITRKRGNDEIVTDIKEIATNIDSKDLISTVGIGFTAINTKFSTTNNKLNFTKTTTLSDIIKQTIKSIRINNELKNLKIFKNFPTDVEIDKDITSEIKPNMQLIRQLYLKIDNLIETQNKILENEIEEILKKESATIIAEKDRININITKETENLNKITNLNQNFDTEFKSTLDDQNELQNKIKKIIGLDDKPNILKCLDINEYNSLNVLSKPNNLNQEELSKLFSILSALLEFLKNMELENFNRQQGIKEICENRLVEGKYINTSLFEVRNTIKQILYEKNNGENISPKFIDECFDQYCPNHEYCFSSEEEEDKRIKSETNPKSEDKNKNKPELETKSERELTDIFGKIYDVLYNDKDKHITDMYKEIIVSVFCVFNISQSANDPPSVPYIDINDLKYIYNFKINNTVKLTEYLIKALNDINKYGSKVKDLKDVLIVSKNLNKDLENSKVFNAIQFMINEKNNNNYFYEQGTFFDNMKKVVKEFIDMIDKNNAISAIGTLEFLDQLAKFNKVSNICRADFNLENAKTIETSNMKYLYDIKPIQST